MSDYFPHAVVRRIRQGIWVSCCTDTDCPGWMAGWSDHPTHAEALAAAWAHIKEHS